MKNIELVFELPEDELKWWKDTMKTYRKNIVSKPRQYVDAITEELDIPKKKIVADVSTALHEIREACWNRYLIDEVEFHREVITYLVGEREMPNDILSGIIRSELYEDGSIVEMEPSELVKKISEVVGDFAGRIMPYLYQLSLSTTNSRRSRAGSTFEAIIDYLLKDVYEYPYEDQSQLGTKFYDDQGIGKMVDGVLPSKKAYTENRSKCQIITMKTTLRERWQEVVEELNRTNIPHIYLLTLDESLSEGVLKQMKSQNITVVTYDWIKKKYPKHKNVISFSGFFNEEIPHTLAYWNK